MNDMYDAGYSAGYKAGIEEMRKRRSYQKDKRDELLFRTLFRAVIEEILLFIFVLVSAIALEWDITFPVFALWFGTTAIIIRYLDRKELIEQ